MPANPAYTPSAQPGVTMGTWDTGNTVTPTDMANYQADITALTQAKQAAVSALGSVTTANTSINVATAPVQTMTIAAATQLAFTGWGPTNTMSDIMLEIFQGSSYALTWPAISWIGPGGVITVGTAGAVLPSVVATLQGSASSPDFIYLFTINNGSTIFGKVMR